MNPGIYTDMTNEAYHAERSAVSNSGISKLVQSPAHFRAYLDEGFSETPALIFGRIAHEAILEPDRFAYAVAPQVDKRTKSGKAEWADFEAENADKHILTSDDEKAILRMRDNVYAHPAAKAALTTSKGRAEVSVFGYQGDQSGELCKCRPDFWRDDNIIVDLKTTNDAGPHEFNRSVFKYGYHRQAAFYLNLCSRAKAEKQEAFIFICVEKTTPYAVAVYMADAEMIEYGRWQYERALLTLAECKINNYWPGYSEKIETISLPAWAKKQMEDAA
jgi:exodeoxyribonuclease VIII